MDLTLSKPLVVLALGLGLVGVGYRLGTAASKAQCETKVNQAESAPPNKDGQSDDVQTKVKTAPKTDGQPEDDRMQFATSKYLLSPEGVQATSKLPSYLTSAAPFGLSQAPSSTPSPVGPMLTFHSDKIKHNYNLLITSVVPRPIAFVTSVNSKGDINAAPFSYFSACNGSPPFITIGFTHSASSGRQRDTLLNIKETKDFVVNIVVEGIAQQVNHTCGIFDKGVNELKQAGLTSVASKVVTAPRCAESPVQMECTAVSITQIHADGSISTPGEELPSQPPVHGSLVLAHVKVFHIAESVYDSKDKSIDVAKLRPVSRLGGCMYGLPTTLFALPRPQGVALKDGQRTFVPQDTF